MTNLKYNRTVTYILKHHTGDQVLVYLPIQSVLSSSSQKLEKTLLVHENLQQTNLQVFNYIQVFIQASLYRQIVCTHCVHAFMYEIMQKLSCGNSRVFLTNDGSVFNVVIFTLAT